MKSKTLLTTISSGMEKSLEVEELVDTRLSLSLGDGSRPPPPLQALLPASPPPENEALAATGMKREGLESGRDGSTSTTRKHGKRARTLQGDSDVDDNDGTDALGGGGAKKKLRLTADQAAVMEKSFRTHNVLSHGEKNDLARQLGLKPRQVEVWFQNRRARTKLKQTEVDCELLRRWCEQVSNDNERLRRELAKLRSSSSTAFLSGLTATTMTVACPSCNKLAAAGYRSNSRD